MFKNYLKVSFKNLLNHKLYSAINLLGMAIGFACSLLIGLFVFDELSYDRQFDAADRIYRVSRNFFPGTSFESLEATNAPQVAGLMKDTYPEVEQATRFINVPVLLRRDDLAFYEDNFIFADAAFFDIFSLEWLQGDPMQALTEIYTIVLTESAAKKYFGNENPLGQTLSLENEFPLRVTGVIRDLPANTHLIGDAFVSMDSVQIYGAETALDQWGNNNFHTYVRLREGADIGVVERQFADFRNRYMQEDPQNPSSALLAMNLRDIHLRSLQDYDLSPKGSLVMVVSFSIIALGIILLACINFMNLSTARYTQRAREVGMRKVLGAERGQIIRQFLGESILLAVLALVLALALVELLLPAFTVFLGRELALDLLGNPTLVPGLFCFAAVVGIIAGSYPAFFLSAFRPSRVLRGDLSRSGTGRLFRNFLVVFQFSVAITLLIATTVVYLQMNLASVVTSGLAKDQIVILSGSRSEGLGAQWDTMKQELLRHREITHVTASDQTPFGPLDKAGPLRLNLDDPERFSMPRMMVDYDFFATYDIGLVAGRTFDPARNDRFTPTNTTGGYILNTAAVREFGLQPDEVIGTTIEFLFRQGPVIGVVEDANFESVRDVILPMLFSLSREGDPAPLIASIRLTGNNLEETLQYVDDTWRKFMPEYPVQRRFLNEDFEALYKSERRQGGLFAYFAQLAIGIACLGLYGLSIFNTEQRRSEIGVRKVLGGSVWSIVLLLTNDFSKLVLLSNLIAWPVAYFVMNRWLENFAYRIDLTPLIFIGSGLIALCIAWVTVGSTAAKAASAKPVLALRYE